MKTYLGILGDPAKLDHYNDQFFSILNQDETSTAFHLIGASESDVTKKDYRLMYQKFVPHLEHKRFDPLPRLNSSNSTSFQSRIGLFPSSASHLIRGPSFVFAPFPINSRSKYLKLKSKFLNFLVSPFISATVLNLAYLPLGGKAASKTRANNILSEDELADLFYNVRRNSWFDWFYLEAGSGQNSLSPSVIRKILSNQASAILDKPADQILSTINQQSGTRYIVPNSIYGGGIRTATQIDELLNPNSGSILVPEVIVVGNISEEDISQTYNILDRVIELNEYNTDDISRIHL